MPKNWKDETCESCEFRDYGTDTHYVCHNKKKQKEFALKVIRVYKHCPACAEYKPKSEEENEG